MLSLVKPQFPHLRNEEHMGASCMRGWPAVSVYRSLSCCEQSQDVSPVWEHWGSCHPTQGCQGAELKRGVGSSAQDPCSVNDTCY